MPRPTFDFDWHELTDEADDAPPSAGTRGRLRWLLGAFGLALAIVLGRAIQLEQSGGEAFRQLAARPVEKQVVLAAPRGRILARDGAVLAADRKAWALSVHYRYLETPSDPHWLRQKARARLSRAQRRDAGQIAAAEQQCRGELADWRRRLAGLCQLSEAEWQSRAGSIQARVNELADTVNLRHRQRWQEQSSTEARDVPLGFASILAGLFAPPERLPPPKIIVAEQTTYHLLVDDLPVETAETIEDAADAFPGVKIVPYTRRRYPHGSLAAGILGHVAHAEPGEASPIEDPAAVGPGGQMGVERSCDARLAGQPGHAHQLIDRRGQLLDEVVKQEPRAGQDVVLTIDARLQQFAEQLLDRSNRRRDQGVPTSHGGAIVVIDVQSGEVLTAASEPRFDPDWFVGGDPRITALLADWRRPLFDRATQMAIPPGSVFKPLTAIALLEHGIVDAGDIFTCQGYLSTPDALRCQIFCQQGIGHGDVTLVDALAQSCNVYFFHHAQRLGGPRLFAWARRFGLGQSPASDGPPTAAGHLPEPVEWGEPGQLEALSIGQGTLAITPLAIARMYAAIANGGVLVEARFTRDALALSPPTGVASSAPGSPIERIASLDDTTLAAVREGLRRVVEDPLGTAHDTVYLSDLAIAGKTGTAQTGAGQADHAWFAGYVPADAPRWALVVALEHGGSGAQVAGTIARQLVQHMRQLGYLPSAAAAEKEFPLGKG